MLPRSKNKKQEAVAEAFEQFTAKATTKDLVDALAKGGYQYSLYNSLLILVQSMHRTEEEQKEFKFKCHSFASWKKQNRTDEKGNILYRENGKPEKISVLKGSKGYYVMVPIIYKKRDKEGDILKDKKGNEVTGLTFKYGSTFDISQTTQYETEKKICRDLDSKIYTDIWDKEKAIKVLDYLKAKGIINTYTITSEVKYKGVHNSLEKSIKIRDGEKDIASTILHECGHAIAHSIGIHTKGTDYATGELYAELFRYLYSVRNGYSFNFEYSRIWQSRIDDGLSLTVFNKAYKELSKFLDTMEEKEVIAI